MRSFSALALGLCLGLATLVSPSGHAQEKIRYVRDWISIPLRETTNPDSTIIHKGVVSGATLIQLDSDDKAGATRVRTEDGVEGWLPTRYLTSEAGARSQLDKAQLEIERLGKLNEQLRIGSPSVAALQESSAKQMADAQAQNSKLSDEVAALKSSIGDNSKLVQDHADLGKHATELQNQVTELNTEIVELRAGQRQSYFRDGALSVGAGALLTLLAANFWPRKKRSDWA
jgi:SH3 domain protein